MTLGESSSSGTGVPPVVLAPSARIEEPLRLAFSTPLKKRVYCSPPRTGVTRAREVAV